VLSMPSTMTSGELHTLASGSGRGSAADGAHAHVHASSMPSVMTSAFQTESLFAAAAKAAAASRDSGSGRGLESPASSFARLTATDAFAASDKPHTDVINSGKGGSNGTGTGAVKHGRRSRAQRRDRRSAQHMPSGSGKPSTHDFF
jgi:hypothetical protein